MTGIEWTQQVWNPTTGCDKVSPGCEHCYALAMAKRLKGMGSAKYQRDGDPRTSGPGFAITEHPAALTQPLTWRQPRRVFVNSMSDLFHQGVTDKFLAQVWAVMAATPQHTYQVLTKRHARMRSLLQTGEFFELVLEEAVEALGLPGIPWPLPNVWVGVSVEDQKRADLRIPALLDTPAAVRFLSCEPLLGPVDLWSWLDCPHDSMSGGGIPGGRWRCDHCAATCHDTDSSPGLGPYRPGLHWVITGGESGHGARPMHPAWARHLHHQCAAAGVAFFFKQTGSVLARRWGCSDPKGHHRAEWPEPFPREYPHAA